MLRLVSDWCKQRFVRPTRTRKAPSRGLRVEALEDRITPISTLWSYDWTPAAPVLLADGNPTAGIAFTNELTHFALGDSDIVATNLRVFSGATADAPDSIAAGDYALNLALSAFDEDGHTFSALLTFTGTLRGTFSSTSANITNDFGPDPTQVVTLGNTTFTVSMGAYSPPGPPSSPNSGSISAHVSLARVGGPDEDPASLSGWAYQDFNGDGQVDFSEQGIPGVSVTLSGTDDLGNAVTLSQQTDDTGYYHFDDLRPGSYSLSEVQPAGFTDGRDTLGTVNDLLSGDGSGNDLFSEIVLPSGGSGINYNFGERPAAGGSVQHGQTATIGFWANKNGQALIKALNGGSDSTQLAQWLAATLPNSYGAEAGAHSLLHPDGSPLSNAEVAAFYQGLFKQTGQKLDAQVMATALAVYATNATLDPEMVAASYGFRVSGDGVGTATVNVGSNGDAFGIANNGTMSVLDLLLATDAQAVNGLLYGGNSTRRSHANSVYSSLNEAGDIG